MIMFLLYKTCYFIVESYALFGTNKAGNTRQVCQSADFMAPRFGRSIILV